MRTCVNFFVGKRSEEGSTEEAMHKREHSAFSPRFGVDPVVSWEDLNPPFCPHGPTLLFRRYYSGKESRQFYACAVHRDRKGCSFFHWADEKICTDKRERWKKAFDDEEQALYDREQLESVRSVHSAKQHYCVQCGILFTGLETSMHSDHAVKQNITDTQLKCPTSLLSPADDRKSQAQFYFSDSSLSLLHDELKRLCFTRVLCVGTPRLHEVLLRDADMDSLLLDIDYRYMQFFTSAKYQRYNMFNHFFYAPDGLEICLRFLKESPSSTAIVLDPPFGGLAEVLAVSINKLCALSKTELSILLVFPYFLESHVTAALPSLWMMDYQVTYINHPHFGENRKKSKPSPVRIFTNLPRPGFKLPAGEDYRFCKLCNKYVAKLNAHCDKCGSCTSKDGQAYVHCDLCEKCSKISRVHCGVCNKCELPQHICGNRSDVGCHICGSCDHKRKECPKKSSLPPRKKRKT